MHFLIVINHDKRDKYMILTYVDSQKDNLSRLRVCEAWG
jgi:hypothetical protein